MLITKAKIILISIVSLIAICGVVLFIVKPWQNYIKLDIQIQKNIINKRVNDSFNIFSECGIIYSTDLENQVPTFLCDNPNIISINYTNGDAKCTSEGSGKMIVSLLDSKQNVIKQNISINVQGTLVFATSATIAIDEITISKNNDSSTNKLTLSENVTAIPIITYQNNLVSYDYKTGKIVPKGIVGNDIVYIKVQSSKTEYIYLQFVVHIIEQQIINYNYNFIINSQQKIEYETIFENDYSVISVPKVQDKNIVEIIDSNYKYILVKAHRI